MSEPIERIWIPARSGKEAQHVYNDIFPGDLVSVSVGELANEAARAALADLNRRLAHGMREAFEAGCDFAVGPVETERPDPFTIRDIWARQPCAFEVKAGPVPAGTQLDLGPGWTIYRLADWKEGRMP